MASDPQVGIGIVGTGFICRRFLQRLERLRGYHATAALSRRAVRSYRGFPAPDLLTDSVDELLDGCDVVLECSGDALHATEVIERAEAAHKPVVTLNTEFHIVAGSHFATRMPLSEAEGDQPGSLAALGDEVEDMGFETLVYGNMKGFLDHHPSPESMAYWAARNGISVPMVTAFTDGTKVQLEQALVANGRGATIARPGLAGPASDDFRAAGFELARLAEKVGRPLSDYVLSPSARHGVFVVARHDERERDCLRYLKMGDGPYYYIEKPNVLVHLEVIKTIRRLIEGRGPLLNNSVEPTVTVAAIAKHDLRPGTVLERGVGSFHVRGEAQRIEAARGCVPIPLLDGATLRRRVARGRRLGYDDVALPESRALALWRSIETRVQARALADRTAAPTTPRSPEGSAAG